MSTSDTSKKARSILGVVVSDKMEKTRTVMVERQFKHPTYKKYITRSTKFHAHDEDNSSKTGDTVRIEECRPLSKTKSWRLIEVVTSAK